MEVGKKSNDEEYQVDYQKQAEIKLVSRMSRMSRMIKWIIRSKQK